MHLLSTLLLALSASLTLAATASITYPATIEIDLLSPLNKTYNANSTSPPIILALQNVQAAYAYEWSIHWAIWESSSPSSEIPGLRGSATSGVGDNEFLYYFGDVGVVPMRSRVLVRLKKGGYRLEWDYAASPCIPEGENAVSSQTRTPVARGTSYFSVVEDGSGVDFDLPVGDGDGCPAFGGSWEVEEEGGCPAGDADGGGGGVVVDGDSACKARLTERGQMDCIWEFLTTGRNETETCGKAFERVDPDWSMYYTPGGSKGNSSDAGSGDGGGGSGSNGTGTSSNGSGSGTGTGTGTGDSKEDVGASQRPVLSGLALGVFGAVVAVMAL